MGNDLELLENLLSQMESSTLDFKRDQYKLESDKQKSTFLKDVICMANTPRDESAYIVIGVVDRNGRAGQIVGISERPDPARFQDIINGRASSPIQLLYREVKYAGLTLGLFEIPVDRQSVPVMTKSNFSDLRRGVTYSRRNAQNCEADTLEIRRISEWAAGGSDQDCEAAIEFSWESFFRACDGFDPARLYLAVLGGEEQLSPEHSQAFAQVDWQLIVDFGQTTDAEQGMFAGVDPYLSQRRSLRLTALDQPIAAVSGTTSIWVAARGLTSRPSTIQAHTPREWNQIKAGPLLEVLQRVAEVTEPQPATAIVFGGETPYSARVCDLFDQAFKARLSFVIANENPNYFSELASQFEASSVPISIQAVCSGLRALKPIGGSSESVELPSLEGGGVVVPPDRARWVEEEADIVHTNLGLYSPTTDSDEPESELQDFLRGNLISWRALNLGVDVSRTNTPRLQQRLSEELESRGTRRLNVWHWPGGGGSTVARRVAWNLHNQYPTVIAKRVVPESLTDRIRFLFELTKKPVLVIVEDSVTYHQELDGLYDRLSSGNIRCVLLTVGRRSAASTQPGSFYVDGILDNMEASAFAARLAAQVPERRTQLERLGSERQSQRRTPFYFGLVAFEKDFVGLEPYVSHRLEEASQPLLDVVRISSLLYHYGQRATPIQLLSSVLSLPRSQTLTSSTILPTLLQELFVQESDRSIRPAHELIAEEVLEQVLSRGLGDKRNWRTGLAQCCIETIEACAVHHDHAGGAIADLVRSVMIERGTYETPASLSEGQFSKLIEAIPSSDGQRRVLEKLTELFPDEAHFWAHLGRFYTRRMREHTVAHDSHTKSIRLAPQDPVLHHMAGMAFRGELEELLDTLDGKTIEDAEERVQLIVQAALTRFETSQELEARREHSYISAIELIARVVRVVGRLKGFDESTANFLVAPGESWYRELVDKAETLMDELILVRGGEEPSNYLQRARANLDRAYGQLSRAIEGWTNLLDRPDIYHPPLRRNIINAYLTRNNRDWTRLTVRELERIAQLAQENLEEQPDNDQNLRIWFRAVRSKGLLPLGHIAERLTYKKIIHPTIDTLYYLSIIKFLQSETEGGQAAEEAKQTSEECALRAANLPHRTRSFEWLGKDSGIHALIPAKDLGNWDPSLEFWPDVGKLKRVHGTIVSIHGPASGEVELSSNGLRAFFVPSKGLVPGGYLRGRDEEHPVSFFLGFSYDGLRAWSVSEPEPT